MALLENEIEKNIFDGQEKPEELDFKFEMTKFFNIEGMIRTTTTIPTKTPTKLDQQILIYYDDLTTPTDKRLYIYSNSAQAWSYVTLT